MPHAHCLFILKDKILSARHIDSVVCAEVPDPVAESELCDLVAKHMLHPMCDIDTSHGCRRDNHNKLCDCRRHFPKLMSPSTIVVVDSYPTYMRRGRHTITLRDGRIITDNWVVPFNRQITHVVSHAAFDIMIYQVSAETLPMSFECRGSNLTLTLIALAHAFALTCSQVLQCNNPRPR